MQILLIGAVSLISAAVMLFLADLFYSSRFDALKREIKALDERIDKACGVGLQRFEKCSDSIVALSANLDILRDSFDQLERRVNSAQASIAALKAKGGK